MALTSALFTGLSGLDVNQTKLNVVGNNIANVNSVAFKSSRAIFQPQFYVTDVGGSPPNADFGGTNPSQRGLGAGIAAIEKDFSPGAIEPTGKATDMAIDGDGFFVVQGTERAYTRAGAFTLNDAHQLVTTNGDFVQGYGVDSSFSVLNGSLQNLTIPIGALSIAKATQNMTLDGNLNASGPVASGASILTSQLLTTVGGAANISTGATPTLLTNIASTSDTATPLFSAGQTFTLAGNRGGRSLADATFTVTATSTIDDLTSFFQQGMDINTTVPANPNPNVPTPGVTIEADATDPNSSRIVMSGNVGKENSLGIPSGGFATAGAVSPFVFADGTNAAGIKSDPNGESVHTSMIAYDSLGKAVNVDITTVLESSTNQGTNWRYYVNSPDSTSSGSLGTGTLSFDGNGKLVTATGNSIAIPRANTGAATPLTLNLDFSKMSAYSAQDSQMAMTHQDGSSFGTLNNFSVGADGTITGTFTNGLTRTLGQIAIATFNNPQGLADQGSNLYTAGANSGVAIVSAPQKLGAGSVRAGALEQSNVDLSAEFINLIVATTGFSAASRVISTSDQLITELLNSSR